MDRNTQFLEREKQALVRVEQERGQYHPAGLPPAMVGLYKLNSTFDAYIGQSLKASGFSDP